jgi:glycosyltransferase involved in cell wall biosynthesis
MAAGLPVLATNAGGPAELITDGVDGLLYPPGDRAALADGLVRLAQDPALRQRLGAAARQSVAHLAPELVAADVVGVYRTLVGVGGSTANRPQGTMPPPGPLTTDLDVSDAGGRTTR